MSHTPLYLYLPQKEDQRCQLSPQRCPASRMIQGTKCQMIVFAWQKKVHGRSILSHLCRYVHVGIPWISSDVTCRPLNVCEKGRASTGQACPSCAHVGVSPPAAPQVSSVWASSDASAGDVPEQRSKRKRPPRKRKPENVITGMCVHAP